jgi:hypothetical protein
MAREIGFFAPDYLESCTKGSEDNDRICKAHILGAWVDTASFSMYVKSAAVAITALVIITIGPIANSGQCSAQPMPVTLRAHSVLAKEITLSLCVYRIHNSNIIDTVPSFTPAMDPHRRRRDHHNSKCIVFDFNRLHECVPTCSWAAGIGGYD